MSTESFPTPYTIYDTRGEWGPKGKTQPQVLTCFIQLLNASLLLESTRSMCITPHLGCGEEENREEKKGTLGRTSNRQPAEMPGDGRRKARVLSPSSIKFSTAWKTGWGCICREHRERHALGQRHTWDPSSAGRSPPGHRLRAGQGGAGDGGGSQQRPLTLKISSNNPNDGTPEEGRGLPGQALPLNSPFNNQFKDPSVPG